MREAWIAALPTAAALTFSAPSQSDHTTAEVGSILVVRGRLAECKTWPNRVLTVSRVPEDGNIKLLGLGPFSVLGRSEAELTESLLAAYARRLPDRARPPARVLILVGAPTRAFLEEAHYSFKQIVSGTCPVRGDPNHPPTWRPQPGYPKTLGPGDFPTFGDVERLAAQLEAGPAS
jgi:hypothetical protein